jgi:hypothetical protein
MCESLKERGWQLESEQRPSEGPSRAEQTLYLFEKFEFDGSPPGLPRFRPEYPRGRLSLDLFVLFEVGIHLVSSADVTNRQL